MARELFIYYRVPALQWRDAVEQVHSLQRHLCAAHQGLSARVLRRPDEQAGEVTLMEVYSRRAAPNGVDVELEAQITREAAAREVWWNGERHVERFDPLL